MYMPIVYKIEFVPCSLVVYLRVGLDQMLSILST